MGCRKSLLAGLVLALLSAPSLATAAANSTPIRGSVTAKLDRSSHTLGELCVASDGSIYAENQRRGKAELLKLDRNGKTLWKVAVFDATTIRRSTFGACDATGAVYGVHSWVGAGAYQAAVARISATGTVEWTREIVIPECRSSLLFDITQDASGTLYAGGRAEKCTAGTADHGYVARFSRDGQQLGVITLEDLEQVRHLSSDGIQIFAVGPTYGGTAIVSLATNGARLWTRTDDDLNLPGPMDGIVTGAAGTYVCATDFRAQALLLVRLDGQGEPLNSWSYANRRTPTLSRCLISAPSQQGLAFIAHGNGSQVEVIRIPPSGTPSTGALIDNPLRLTLEYGITDDGFTLYAGGSDSGRTQIVSFGLPEPRNTPPVAGACLTPATLARIDAKRRLADEAEKTARHAIDARIESILQAQPWTDEQKHEFRKRQPLLVQDEYLLGQENLLRQFEQQLSKAGTADCESIELQLGMKLDSVKEIWNRQERRVDQVAGQAIYLGRPEGAAPSDEELRYLQLRWAQRIHSRIDRVWRRPQILPPRTCRIEMSLTPDGQLIDIRIAESSGSAEFDAGILDVIQQNAPYAPPLKPLTGSTTIRLGFQVQNME